ncbi:hypothetical protein [Nitrobacter sp.]|uniref:hypothetical protein n=1 Tax=Nitrobacter sp. TaxID=29420 RepID=UPI00399D699E
MTRQSIISEDEDVMRGSSPRMATERSARAFPLLMETEAWLYVFVLTHFLDANR